MVIVAGVAAWSLHSPGCLLQGLCESRPCVAEYRFKINGRRNLNFVLNRQNTDPPVFQGIEAG